MLPSPHCSMTGEGDASAARTTNLDSGTAAAESGPSNCPFKPSSELVGELTVGSCSEPLIMIKRRSTPLAPAIIYGVRVQVSIVLNMLPRLPGPFNDGTRAKSGFVSLRRRVIHGCGPCIFFNEDGSGG